MNNGIIFEKGEAEEVCQEKRVCMTVEIQEELMMQAAIMYYQKDMTQADIARELFLCRTKVSRLLKLAKEQKKVEICISGEEQRRNAFLEKLFKEQFGLKEALILADAAKEETFLGVARLAAQYTDSILTKTSVVGIGRGRTLRAVVECMQPREKLPIQVVQLIGLMNNPSQNEEEMDLVRKFARMYGGTCHNLFAPFVLEDSEARQVLNRVAAVGRTIELAKSADVILSSVGKFDLTDKSILWNSYLEQEEKLHLKKMGSVGLFCGRYYDINGKMADTELHDKIFGLDVEEIVSREHVICIAQGGEKVLPILGALHGRLFNTLITDERTAVNVLIQEGKMVGD